MASEGEKSERTAVSQTMTSLSFYIWLTVLLADLATFALGILGHIVILFAAPWLPLRTEVTIQAAIPVLLTAVKLVTIPLLLLLTPFARHHDTFKFWSNWAKAKFHRLGDPITIPWRLLKAAYWRALRQPETSTQMTNQPVQAPIGKTQPRQGEAPRP